MDREAQQPGSYPLVGPGASVFGTARWLIEYIRRRYLATIDYCISALQRHATQLPDVALADHGKHAHNRQVASGAANYVACFEGLGEATGLHRIERESGQWTTS